MIIVDNLEQVITCDAQLVNTGLIVRVMQSFDANTMGIYNEIRSVRYVPLSPAYELDGEWIVVCKMVMNN